MSRIYVGIGVVLAMLILWVGPAFADVHEGTAQAPAAVVQEYDSFMATASQVSISK